MVVHGYLSLIGIEGDFHIDYCSYNILMQQAFTVTTLSGFCATYFCRVRAAYHSMAFRLINPKKLRDASPILAEFCKDISLACIESYIQITVLDML